MATVVRVPKKESPLSGIADALSAFASEKTRQKEHAEEMEFRRNEAERDRTLQRELQKDRIQGQMDLEELKADVRSRLQKEGYTYDKKLLQRKIVGEVDKLATQHGYNKEETELAAQLMMDRELKKIQEQLKANKELTDHEWITRKKEIEAIGDEEIKQIKERGEQEIRAIQKRGTVQESIAGIDAAARESIARINAGVDIGKEQAKFFKAVSDLTSKYKFEDMEEQRATVDALNQWAKALRIPFKLEWDEEGWGERLKTTTGADAADKDGWNVPPKYR